MAKKAKKASLVYPSRIKEIVKGKKVRAAGDFIDGVNAAIEELVNKAIKRAEANGRKTVRSKDI